LTGLILFCDAHHVPDAHRRIVLVGEHRARIHDRVLMLLRDARRSWRWIWSCFYLFFEAGLIPMFLIIGIWGGGEPCLCVVQFFLLYLPRVGIDAGGVISCIRRLARQTFHPDGLPVWHHDSRS
jgi:hypothetical protein